MKVTFFIYIIDFSSIDLISTSKLSAYHHFCLVIDQVPQVLSKLQLSGTIKVRRNSKFKKSNTIDNLTI